MLEFMIQLCHLEQAPRLAALIHDLATEEGEDVAEVEDITNIVSALIQSGASDFLLATVGDRPVGCMQIAYRLSTWHALPYAYIEDFYLAPEVRGRGVGTKMLDYALQRAEGQGSSKIALDVRRANTAAQRLYERFGFTDSQSFIMSRPLPLGDAYCDTTTTLAAIEELRGATQTEEQQ